MRGMSKMVIVLMFGAMMAMLILVGMGIYVGLIRNPSEYTAWLQGINPIG